MPKILRTIALVALGLAASTAQAGAPRGTSIELKSIPSFVGRLFVPTVAGTSNHFSISRPKIDAIVEAPKNFPMTLRNGVLEINAPQGDAWAYARVKAGGRLKLELMQQELFHYLGLRFGRFTIMSGHRTPYYNALIGNETSYSRHLYGDAVDIYVDDNGDGNMDDINKDGRVDRRDAIVLLDAAEKIDRSREWGWLKGGAGVYNPNRAHGPYLHIDTRGSLARWGV